MSTQTINELTTKQNITAIKAFSDNYIWCVHNTKYACVVDPGDAAPVLEFLTHNQLDLLYILITHHHWDHVGGITELKSAYPNAIIYGPMNPKIDAIEYRLVEGNEIQLKEFDLTLSILETPGHTLDHIVYKNRELVFCGDTLFSGGCGRMFEGTPEVFYSSLQKLANLPKTTKVFCTHEYTQANLAFGLSVDPSNKKLNDYNDWVEERRKNDQITLPSNIGQEIEINPFLRCHSEAIRQTIFANSINGENDNSVSVTNIATFAKLRKLKDNF